jgi:hypothetical protein
MARQRAFLWVSAYHPLTRLAASHLSRQGANYGQRVVAAIGKCFRLILNKFAHYEGRYVLQWGVTIANFLSCLRQKQTSQKTVCRASHTQATALVDTAAARTITHNTFVVRSQGTVTVL